jgi:hypothetical protein
MRPPSKVDEPLRQGFCRSTADEAGAAGNGGAPGIILILRAGLDVEALHHRIGDDVRDPLLQTRLSRAQQPVRALGAEPNPAFRAQHPAAQLAERRRAEFTRSMERAHAVIACEISYDLAVFLAQVIVDPFDFCTGARLIRGRRQTGQRGKTKRAKHSAAVDALGQARLAFGRFSGRHG